MFSLLRPEGEGKQGASRNGELGGRAVIDLDLGSTVEHLCLEGRHRRSVERILYQLCPEPQVIRYRQDVLADLLSLPELTSNLQALLPRLESLNRYRAVRWNEELLFEVTWRLGELETYVECVRELGALLGNAEESLSSTGLRKLKETLDGVQRDEVFRNLIRELPGLLARVRNIASVTIGVNLDENLQPVEATLISINRKKYSGSSPTLLNRLFGVPKRKEQWRGLTQLHRMRVPKEYPGTELDSLPANPIMTPLFRDLSEVLARVCKPIAAALQRYVGINSSFLADLGQELAFYLGAIRLLRGLQTAGFPLCRPELAPAGERAFEIEEAYNLNLALRLQDRNRMVTNHIAFRPGGNVFVLTGPNQGGKTTYMQAVGLAQLLSQAGLYVPGSRARISPVDGIYTHFPVEERPELDTGRLGEEAERLAEIFSRATPNSLLLLNESLSNTSPRESFYLALDLLKILRLLGARAIFTTHLHELAAEVESLNADQDGGIGVFSLVSQVEEREGPGSSPEIRRTYKIEPGPPQGLSYASEIASRYGISYRQLLERLRSRGLLD